MALSTISGTTGITDATITSAKLADFSAAVDLNGVELLLDADADTSITADTDDRIDFKLGGVEHISLNNSSGDTVIKPMVDGKDIVFQQYDGNKILEINDGNYVAISGAAAGPGELRFYEDTDLGAHYTGFKAGNATASLSYVLPLADGTDGYALTTDGSGTLSWAAVSANTPTSADGQALGSASLEWSDLFLADGAVINFGADQEVSLTHVHNTGLLLSSTDQLQFGDSGTYIFQSADGVLDLVSDTEIELNATTLDINANVEISGTATTTGVHTFTAVPVLPANSIDSDHYVDASIDNAHLADDAVGVAELSATGTASSSTFLRGDNAWAAISAGGRLLRITRYTSPGSGTWTRPSDTVSVLIRTVAGGGAGATGGNHGTSENAGGGGGGGAAELYIASAASSYAYVVGAGGGGSAATGTHVSAGGDGGETTIAGISGGGGSGGPIASSDALGDGGAGGTPSGGTINLQGGAGEAGSYNSNSTPLQTNGGGGGDGAGPNGGAGGEHNSAAGGGARMSGLSYGGGGCGGKAINNIGGTGGGGYIEIQEYS